MKYKYMRENTKDKYGIKGLQDKILEIMVDVDLFCKRNRIEYYLMGGSALGAKRHKGFIPWDDDLDIFMTPKNYEKFKSTFLQESSKDKYYIQEYGTVKSDKYVSLAKVRMNGTTFIEETVKKLDIHHGIYVDIFILHNSPNNKLLQLRQFYWAKYIVLYGLSKRSYKKRKGFVSIVMMLLKRLPKDFLLKKAFKEVYRFQNRKTDYVSNFLGKAMFKKGLYKKQWFDNVKSVNFENVQLCVPQGIEEFLTERFGNYMSLPSQNQIEWEQHALIWDLDNDFSKYVDTSKYYKDEIFLL